MLNQLVGPIRYSDQSFHSDIAGFSLRKLKVYIHPLWMRMLAAPGHAPHHDFPRKEIAAMADASRGTAAAEVLL